MKLLDNENFYQSLFPKEKGLLTMNDKKILYLDNHLLVVIKDANELTQPTDMDSNSLQDLAKDFIKQKFNKKTVFLHPIHRLDKEVSGLIIFARSSKALSRLNKQMREKKIIKKYIAEIEGKLSKKKDELKDYIIHLSHRAKIGKKGTKNAKFAHLSYKVIKEKTFSSIVQIELFTGRYHQIRAQFANIGHPIIGDRKYFSEKDLKKIHLHCFYLEFLHPVTQKILQFQKNPFFLNKEF